MTPCTPAIAAQELESNLFMPMHSLVNLVDVYGFWASLLVVSLMEPRAGVSPERNTAALPPSAMPPPWSRHARGQQATDHLGPHYERLWTRLAALELFHHFPVAADDLTGQRWPASNLLCFR
jgi:hypothetical protein